MRYESDILFIVKPEKNTDIILSDRDNCPINNNDKPKINPENINEKSNNEFGFKEEISFNDEKKINPKKNEKSKIL